MVRLGLGLELGVQFDGEPERHRVAGYEHLLHAGLPGLLHLHNFFWSGHEHLLKLRYLVPFGSATEKGIKKIPKEVDARNWKWYIVDTTTEETPCTESKTCWPP